MRFRAIAIGVIGALAIALGSVCIGKAFDREPLKVAEEEKKSANSATYDDPAVVVCELRVKKRLTYDVQYRRLNAKIDGHVVHIIYETTFANTKPKAGTVDCDFARSLADPKVFVFAERNKILSYEGCKPKSLKNVSAASEHLAREIVEECTGLFTILRQLEEPALKTMLYPIPAADTKLAQ
jgi:hypothetical protein